MSREQLCLLCREKSTPWEIPSAREKGLQLYGRSIASRGEPKGCRGRAESPLLFCRNIYTPLGFSPTTARRFPKGNVGKRVPSGHNRRRQLATRSSGKQQAGRTAVRAAPIVCPEESPLLAAIVDNLVVRKSPLVGNDAPTPARIGTGRPMGRSHFSFGGERKVCKRKPAARRLREKALYCPF